MKVTTSDVLCMLYAAMEYPGNWSDILGANIGLAGFMAHTAGVAVNLHAGVIHRDPANCHHFRSDR